MSTKCTCPVCAHVFAARNAYCEDWRVPEKSFACPNCRTFLERRRNERVRMRPYIVSVIGLTVLAVVVVYVLHASGYETPHMVALSVASIVIPMLSVVLMRRFTVRTGPALVPYPGQ